MKTTKTIGLLSVGLILGIFLINLVNAQTLVAGKIYNSGYTDVIKDVSITVTCNSNVLTTTSLDDGTYAVKFNENLCGLGNSVNVNAIKEDLSSSGSGTVIECDSPNDCTEGYVSIINLAIKAKQTSSSSSSSSSGGCRTNWKCNEWSSCIGGKQIRTCSKENIYCYADPKDKPVEEQTCSVETIEPKQSEEIQNLNPENNENQGGLSKITGAVVGTLGTGWLIVIIFIIGILVLSLIVRFIRNRKTITETI